MKILKIFAIVVGIHIFALVLIFANPGCSSTTKPAPAPTDTAMQPAASAPLNVPVSANSYGSAVNSAPAPSSSPISFNPDAPAVAASSSASSGGGLRVTPTRPGSPVANVLVSEPVMDVTPATTYVVKSGDSLWSVAKKNHLTVAELTGANSLKANATLRPGQKLVIPGKPASPTAAATATGGAGPTPKATEATAAPAATTKVPAEGIKHTVKSGETLGAIARTYGVKAADIAVANNISDPAKIKAGDQLTIPGWQTPGAKSGKAPKGTSSKSADTKKGPAPEPDASAAQPAPPAPPPVPIIQIPESPVTPAPKP